MVLQIRLFRINIQIREAFPPASRQRLSHPTFISQVLLNMMPQPILCQTPTRGLLNLSYARQIRFCDIHLQMSWRFVCFITWNNGDEQTFDGKDAKAIAQTVKKLHKLNIEPALP